MPHNSTHHAGFGKNNKFSSCSTVLVPSKIQLFMHKVFGYTVFDQESVDYLDSILDKVLEETPSENEVAVFPLADSFA